MCTLQRTRIPVKGEQELIEYRRLVFSHAPALGSLLDQLDAGIFPGPLEVMIAISQGVDFLTNCPDILGGPQACGFLTPGVRCSSC